MFISNIDKNHTIKLKINLKVQEDELKNCLMMTWKTSWKNDISFASPPPQIKCHFYSYFQNLIFFWHLPPFLHNVIHFTVYFFEVFPKLFEKNEGCWFLKIGENDRNVFATLHFQLERKRKDFYVCCQVGMFSLLFQL